MEYFSYFSFIIFKMLFFIFWPLPEKLFDCPKKIFCPTLGGCSPPPPAHTPMRRETGVLLVAEFDECATDAHGCHHECVNTLGGFQCKCHIGYELHSDGRQCEGKPACTPFSPAALHHHHRHHRHFQSGLNNKNYCKDHCSGGGEDND